MKQYISPKPDEERSYMIGTFNPIHVRIKGIPPCLWCGEPVTDPSMDGPLVCPWCDMGKNRDGTPWSAKDHFRLSEHFNKMVTIYREQEITQPKSV
jgi:hypothetical protein